MGKAKEITGKVPYRLLFPAVIPIILIPWAKYTSDIVTLRLPVNLLPGYILLVTGAILVCSGLWYLRRFENGLSVKAFPSKKYIKNGIYDFTRYPIHSGAALISFGLSAVTRSASGFWLVSPIFILLMTAYTAGFKNVKVHSAFSAQDYKPFLSLPSASDILPSFSDRISSYFLVFVPWLIIYKVFIFIGAPADAIHTNLPFEEHLRHPAQLYSIGANIIKGLVLIRLFNMEIPSSFIVGMYLILEGTSRFVEGSFRGEVQKPNWSGMKIYQRIAILIILSGIMFTAVPAKSVLIFQPNFLSLILVIVVGIFVTIASGMDFPESNRHFTRLTSN